MASSSLTLAIVDVANLASGGAGMLFETLCASSSGAASGFGICAYHAFDTKRHLHLHHRRPHRHRSPIHDTTSNSSTPYRKRSI